MPYLGNDGLIHSDPTPPAPLDPVPTMFGISRIASEDGDGGSGEYLRAVAWINQRAARYGFRAWLVSLLIGDGIAAQNRQADYQPLIDFFNDLQQDVPPDMENEPYIGNQTVNT